MKFSTTSTKTGVRLLEGPPWRCLQSNMNRNLFCCTLVRRYEYKSKDRVCTILFVALPVHSTRLSVRSRGPLGPQVWFSPGPSRHRHRSQQGSNNPISSFRNVGNLGSTGATWETCCCQTWVFGPRLGESAKHKTLPNHHPEALEKRVIVRSQNYETPVLLLRIRKALCKGTHYVNVSIAINISNHVTSTYPRGFDIVSCLEML